MPTPMDEYLKMLETCSYTRTVLTDNVIELTKKIEEQDLALAHAKIALDAIFNSGAKMTPNTCFLLHKAIKAIENVGMPATEIQCSFAETLNEVYPNEVRD